MLVKTIVLGLKNTVWGINSVKSQQLVPQQPNGPPPKPRPPTLEECLLYRKLLRDGLRCFVALESKELSPTLKLSHKV